MLKRLLNRFNDIKNLIYHVQLSTKSSSDLRKLAKWEFGFLVRFRLETEPNIPPLLTAILTKNEKLAVLHHIDTGDEKLFFPSFLVYVPQIFQISLPGVK